MSKSTQHVLIVGCGLAGPALAKALSDHNIRSTVFEIRGSPSEAGGSISLSSNALRILDKQIGVLDRVRPKGFVYETIHMYSDDLYHFGDVSFAEKSEKEDYKLLRIMRATLQSCLVEACQEKPDMIRFVWNARISHVKESADGITAFFEDGSSHTGDVLIGADGIHSKTREILLGSAAPNTKWAGTCIISASLPKDNVKTPPDFVWPAMFMTPSGMIMGIQSSPDGKTMSCGDTFSELEERDRDGWTEYTESGQAFDALKRRYENYSVEPLRSLIDAIQPDQIKMWTPYSIPVLPTWHNSRICLLGDAAHALPPNGQGVTMAFEDAALMAKLLSSQGAVSKGYEKVFAHFEKLRKARLEIIAKVAQKGEVLKGASSNALLWWLKTWLIWAFFAWNGGSVRNKELTSYDVDKQDLQVQ